MSAVINMEPADAALAGGGRSILKRYLRDPVGVSALVVFVLIVLAAVCAPLIAMHNPNTVNLMDVYASPSWQHLLGVDETGRDVWARLVYGARPTLIGALITVITGVLLGLPTGVVAGYYRGRFEAICTWISNALQSVPGMIILLVVAGATHDNFVVLMVTIGVFMAPGYFRVAQSGTRIVRAEPFVDAARVAGLGDGRIMCSHILRAIAAPMIIQTTLTAGMAMGMQAGLQFLGLGSTASASWGQMISSAFAGLPAHQFLLVPPVVALGLSITCVALIGQSLADITGAGARAVTKPPKLEPRPARSPAVKPADDIAVQVVGLRVGYRTTSGVSEVVRNVDLQVRRGEVLGIVGESGSGKSQTVFSIMDLLPSGGLADAEAIWVEGVDVSRLSRRDRHRLLGKKLGYVPQEPMGNLDPTFTVGHQLTEPLRSVMKLSRSEARARAVDLLTRVGISDPDRVMASYPHQISGGMAQRVLIAGAIASRPSVLIADEPTTALDVTVQAEVLELLRELQTQDNLTMILVSHNFGVIADICDRVVVMQHGVVVEQGDVGQVLSAPSHPYTAELVAANLEESESRSTLDAMETSLEQQTA